MRQTLTNPQGISLCVHLFCFYVLQEQKGKKSVRFCLGQVWTDKETGVRGISASAHINGHWRELLVPQKDETEEERQKRISSFVFFSCMAAFY